MYLARYYVEREKWIPAINRFKKVVNEYENLKIVLVHTPGSEINQLTPDNLSRLLFEDMPYLPKAIEEHNQFKKKMKDRFSNKLKKQIQKLGVGRSARQPPFFALF